MTPPLTPTGPEFRPLSEPTLPFVAALYCEVFNAPPWNDGWTGDTAYARLRDILNTPGSLGLLAWQDEQLTGCILGYAEQWFDGVHFYVKEMFVHPALQRCGIGTQMLRELKHTLRRQARGRLCVNQPWHSQCVWAREDISR